MVHVSTQMLDAYIQSCVGRRNDYAVQLENGRYARVGDVLTYQGVFRHVQGLDTIGSYVINEQGQCWFAVFDSDALDGLQVLFQVQQVLLAQGIVSYLEQSRRGGHLWVFLAQAVLPVVLRSWLLPFCPSGVEFYPKQDRLDGSRSYGSLIRLPLGVHRLSGERYPFVSVQDGVVIPLFHSLVDAFSWFATVERVTPPSSVPALDLSPSHPPRTPTTNILQSSVPDLHWSSGTRIQDWCRLYDPLVVIERYVTLDAQGTGCCPFGWHHDDGVDAHPSFRAYRPAAPDVMCWYCHTWGRGGSLFDFLRFYYQLEARDLWQRLITGMQF